MTRAARVIAFIEHYCRVPEGALVGSPLHLEEFQKEFIEAIYQNPAGTKKAYLSLARKNGKTALIACLVLDHLVGPESKQNSQIVSGAMSRDQAGIIFTLTAKMIRLNPELADLVRVVDSRKELYGLPMNVQFKDSPLRERPLTDFHPCSPSLTKSGRFKAQSPHSLTRLLPHRVHTVGPC